MEVPIVDGLFDLHKIPGKGGWTYAELPFIPKRDGSVFGWIKVKGSIDSHIISNLRIMPMGNKRLFLPLKASIRKTIRKEAGTQVKIILYVDETPQVIPEELIDCLMIADAFENFLKLSDGQQKGFITWIYDAKRIETRVERITKAIDLVLKGEKYPNPINKNNM